MGRGGGRRAGGVGCWEALWFVQGCVSQSFGSWLGLLLSLLMQLLLCSMLLVSMRHISSLGQL